jgi:hypothetical protein
MEEAALGEPGSFADVLDARGGVAFGTDDVQGGIEEPFFDSCLDSSFVSAGAICTPTGWYAMYLLMGMLSRVFAFCSKRLSQTSFLSQSPSGFGIMSRDTLFQYKISLKKDFDSNTR